MLSEVTHLQELVQSLGVLSQDPACLPESTEQAIYDATHGASTPQSTLERKVRLCFRVVKAVSKSQSSPVCVAYPTSRYVNRSRAASDKQ